MNNFTIKNLRNEIGYINKLRIRSHHVALIGEQGRNGYQAIDEYRICPDGTVSLQRMLEGGSSRECAYSANTFSDNEKVTSREQAKVVLALYGVNFDSDFYQLDRDTVEFIHELAQATKYRKPAAANGSLARYFYAHLRRAKYDHLKLNRVRSPLLHIPTTF